MASLAREVMSLRTRLEVLNSEDFQKIVVR